MIIILQVLIFGILTIALIDAIVRMGSALDNEDLSGFFIWTCVASVIAGFPLTL